MNLFSYIKSQLSILDVIGEYASLKKAGLYWKGNCPFHHEKTASFTVSPHKEIFYCFGCNTGGDVIAFIAKAEHCSPLDAAKMLIERYTLTIPEELSRDNNFKDGHERDRYFQLCQTIALWAHQMLHKYHAPLSYLEHRGVSSTMIDYFGLGYLPGGPQSIKAFLSFMQQHHFLVDELLQANFLAQGRTVLYSPFEERILFPIKDHLGRFCGFGGRTYKPSDERAKYYNSRENAYFCKGSLLFGFDLAKQSIQKQESLFLVEGYLDCIAMVQHGHPNTVATLGTACTTQHLTTVARYANQLYILYDGDHAGQEAMLRMAQLCWQVSMDLQVIVLPLGEDPASFLGKRNQLGSLIENAMDIFIYFIHTTGKDIAKKTLSEKLSLTHKILDIIQKIEDPLKQDFLLQKASTLLELPFQSLKDALRTTKKAVQPPQPHPQEEMMPTPETYPLLEKKLFFAIMHNVQLLHRNNEEYLLEYLPKPLQSILAVLQQAKEVNPTLEFSQFFDMLDTTQQQITSKIMLEGEADCGSQEFDQMLVHLQKKHWKVIVHTIKIKLAQAESQDDKEKIGQILHDFLQLKKKILCNSFSKDV